MTAPDPALLSLNTATVREQLDARADHRRLRAPRHPRRSRPGATRSPKDGAAGDGGAPSRRGPDAVRVLPGRACSRRPTRPGRAAAMDDNRRAVDEALALGAPCLVLVVGGLPKERRRNAGVEGPGRRAGDGARRHRRTPRLRAAGRHAARDRAAAPDVRGGPRLREHDGARQRPVRRAGRRPGHRRRRLPRLVGPDLQREIERAGRARAATDVAAAGVPRLRLAGADRATCCSTAA